MDVPIKGINSEEVKLARDLSTGKKVDNEQLFICEGLWAVEKIIKKRIKVEMFFFCPDMIKTEQDKKKTNLMIEYCKDSYQISQKACRKISDRDGADGFFIICHMPRYDIEKLPQQASPHFFLRYIWKQSFYTYSQLHLLALGVLASVLAIFCTFL